MEVRVLYVVPRVESESADLLVLGTRGYGVLRRDRPVLLCPLHVGGLTVGERPPARRIPDERRHG